MSTLYPSTIDTAVNPISSNPITSPDLATQQSFHNDAIIAIETKLGINSSAVTTTVDYKLSGVPGGSKAASLTGAENLSNKTLVAPTINMGSDVNGDIYIRASGLFSRLAAGTANQILTIDATSGLPKWAANPAASNGSLTVAGVYQAATQSQYNANTTVGSTGALLVVTPDLIRPGISANNFVQLNGSAQLPAVDGSLLTNLPTPPSFQIITGDTTGSLTQRFSATATTTGVSASNPLYMSFGISTIGNIHKFNLDSVTKQFVDSGVSAVLNTVSNPSQNSFLAVLGTNLYQSYSTSGATYTLVQFTASTLASGTNMTISGTGPTGNNTQGFPIFSDGTFLYIYGNAGAGVFNKYSVSGTTITFVTAITYTNSTSTDSIWCDGVSVYQYVAASTLYKWPLAGGAPTSSSTTTRLAQLSSLTGSYGTGLVQSGTYLLALIISPISPSGVNVYSTPITKP